VDRLGHERRVQAVLLGDRLQRELEGDRVVRGLQRIGVLEVDLVLARGHLVMGRLHPDAERLEGVDHVVPDGTREVRAEVEVAGLVVGQRLDGAVVGAAEQEELQLRPHVHDVAQLLRPLHLAAEDEARVAGKRLAAWREHVADHPGGLALRPRDLGEGPHVRHEVLVALGDPGEALDRRAVEPGAVADRALELVDRDRHRLDDAHDVGELELDEPDAFFLGRLDLFHARHRFVGCNHRSCLLASRAGLLCSAHQPGPLGSLGSSG
jgi:hypothetical protein